MSGLLRPWAPDPHQGAAAGFASYVAMVYPGGPVPERQREQLEQAFMGGVAWVLAKLLEVADHPEDEGAAMLANLQAELVAWNMARASAAGREVGHG